MHRRAFLAGTLSGAGLVLTGSRARGALAASDATPVPENAFAKLEIGLKDDGFVVPDSIQAGRYHVVVSNLGTSDASHFALGHIPDDITDEQYEAWLNSGDGETEDLSFEDIEFVGVPDWPKAGKQVSGVIDLVAGRYFLFDPFDARGQMTLMIDGQFSAGAEPESDLTVTLADMTITLPETAFSAGPKRWKIENIGGISHEVAIVPVDPAFTEEDLMVLFTLPEEATPPAGVENLDYEPITAIGILARGHTSWLDAHLDAGHYVALCMLPFGTGYPHGIDGMYRFFEVK
jgi:hypothetical protein